MSYRDEFLTPGSNTLEVEQDEPTDDADAFGSDGAGSLDAATADDDSDALAAQWTTPDGDVLHISPRVLNSFVLWLRRRRSRARGGRRTRRILPALPRAERRRARRSVARMARRARRGGAFRHRGSERHYPVFRTRAGRSRLRMITRPRGGRRFEILGIEAELGELGSGFLAGELEVLAAGESKAWHGGGPTRLRVRGAHAEIRWSRPKSIAETMRTRGGGVYVVYRAGKPIYVGETASFARRWLVRLDALTNLAVDPSQWTVHTGVVKSVAGPQVADALLRQDVEHVLVRVLRNAGFNLANRKPINKLVANASGILIRNLGTRPPDLPRTVRVTAGAQLELEAAE